MSLKGKTDTHQRGLCASSTAHLVRNVYPRVREFAVGLDQYMERRVAPIGWQFSSVNRNAVRRNNNSIGSGPYSSNSRNIEGSTLRIVGFTKIGTFKLHFARYSDTLEDELTVALERVRPLFARDTPRIVNPNLNVSAKSLIPDKRCNPWRQNIKESCCQEHGNRGNEDASQGHFARCTTKIILRRRRKLSKPRGKLPGECPLGRRASCAFCLLFVFRAACVCA